jgi:hypothetical protein
MSEQMEKIAKQHHKEVRGEGYWPLDPKYIDEFITRKARLAPEWAIAYALLQVAQAISGAGRQIGGVDGFTGIQGVGAVLGALVDAMMDAKKKGEA